MARLVRAFALLALVLTLLPGELAQAQAPTALARTLSDQAFALLDTLNATHAHSQPSALLGPIGMYAADSQTLLRALKENAGEQAGAALAALERDQAAVDSTLQGAGADLNRAQWTKMKEELATLKIAIPATAASEAVPTLVPAGTGASSDLSVRIDSTRFDSADQLHIKGVITGRDITSAGIYAGNEEITDLRPTPDRRDQRIELDLTIAPPPAGSVIRVYDGSAGRGWGNLATNEPTGPQSLYQYQPVCAGQFRAAAICGGRTDRRRGHNARGNLRRPSDGETNSRAGGSGLPYLQFCHQLRAAWQSGQRAGVHTRRPLSGNCAEQHRPNLRRQYLSS